MPIPPLSILDLARIREGSDVRGALDAARDGAVHAERLGYTRYWLAEHHGMAGIASAATAVAIAHVAAGTSRIRVGAGGIMLPNHAPFVIAEQFGTLEALYPGRIDLGLGRAPGSDQLTARALRRSYESAEAFPNDVVELQAWLGDPAPNARLRATPGAGSKVPLWILGSSTFGAALAAQLGLPYAFASHFAPAALHEALAVYRTHFRPSDALARPHAMVGVNVIAAESDTEARRLWTTQQMSFAELRRGTPSLSRPPIDRIEDFWNPAEAAMADAMLACSVVGSVDTVRAGLERLAAETQADEFILVSDVWDTAARHRSLQLIAEAAGLEVARPV